MPKTKIQEIVFTVMMVIVMVYGMVVYNISLDMGGLTNQVFVIALGELWIMGIVAFLLELLFVGKFAQKMAFRMVNPRSDRPIVIILAISVMTVCFMCPIMSFIATVLFKGGFDIQVVAKWVQTTVMNFPMALGWQIFFALWRLDGRFSLQVQLSDWCLENCFLKKESRVNRSQLK